MQSLSQEQRRLVRENLGLVGLHLRRFVPPIPAPRRDREWEDLFQEGCLGVVRAAVAYDPARKIPFAAFALPRIHQAVSCALHEKFTMIAQPEPRRAKGRKTSARERRHPFRGPRLRSLSEAPTQYMKAPRQNPAALPAGETIGDRLRGKFERGVRDAAEQIIRRGRSSRDDRPQVIRRVVEERLLVPQPQSRTPLRRLAAETGSSYARIAQCEHQIREMVGERLEADPEFLELQRQARHDPAGLDTELDGLVETALANASAAEFVRQFKAADHDNRTAMLSTLLELSPAAITEALREQIVRLPAESREKVLRRGRAEFEGVS